MKKIIFILALFVSLVANSQYTPPSGYTNINSRYDWLAGVFRALGLPAGGNAAFTTGQSHRAGAIYYDSTGVDSGLYVWSGLAWRSYEPYTDADARAAISLTTIGTSGAATYDNGTGVFNIPVYAGTLNANAGAFYRWLIPSTQEIKTFAPGYGVLIDSTSNTDALTAILDTATVFPDIRATIPSSGANTALSNLASVAINTSLISDTDITDDLGSSSISWKDIFANVLKAGNGSISAPSISFKNSTNTGFYYTSADAGSLWLTLQGVTMGRLGFQHPTSSTFNQGNTFLGYEAGAATGSVGSTNSFHNTFIGGIAGKANTSGNQNTGIGSRSLSANTTGNRNTAVGQGSLFNAITASDNVAMGYHALLEVLGSNNVAIGEAAMQGAVGSTAGQSTAVGMQALTMVTTATNNTALGRLTLGSLTTSPNNTASGLNAGFLITTGSGGNTLNGYQAGYELTTGAYNIIVGAAVQAPSATGSGQLNIGNVLYGSGLHQSTSRTSTPTTTGSIGIGLTTPTARLHLPAGTTAASTAPLKFTSGSLQTTAEAGAIEFLTDKFYGTITTGAARKEFTLNDAALTSGRIPFVTTNGRLTDVSTVLWDGTTATFPLLKITGGSPDAGKVLTSDADGDATWTTAVKPTLTKNAMVENPTASENLFMFRTPVAITVTDVTAVLVGGTPSVTYNIAFGTDRTSGTNVYTAGQTVTSETTGDAASGVNDATIPAGSWVWITTSAATDVTQLNISLTYTED